MAQVELQRTERLKRRYHMRSLLVAGTLFVLFWPELLFAHSLFFGERSVHVFIADQEAMGFAFILVMAAHGLQVPLLIPLGTLWYGVARRNIGLARAGYGMLVPVAAAVGYVFFALGVVWWLPVITYGVGLLLLSPSLMRHSPDTP